MALRYFDINWQSWLDGPGQRVVLFLQGCPLNCPWCHLPHSQNPQAAPLLYFDHLCQRCGRCVEACPHQVHRLEEGRHYLDRDRCRQCGACVAACPGSSALYHEGCLVLPTREEEAETVFAALLPQLRLFARRGGLTISGGEALVQAKRVSRLLELCRRHRIHTAVETSGTLSAGQYLSVLDLVDTWLFGLRPHRKDSGLRQFKQALTNLDLLLEQTKPESIIIRLPVIPGYLDSPGQLISVARAMSARGLRVLQLLPFNSHYSHYYEAAGLPIDPALHKAKSRLTRQKIEEVLRPWPIDASWL